MMYYRGIKQDINFLSFGIALNVSGVVTDKGTYELDFVVLCIGFRPNTAKIRNTSKWCNRN
ncbi:hypothetical protein [Cellulosilyticum ruminicola]|uniref:hypothetical protein n=1 Tax=Cellulosilyticum ruminicola TaxID=425254 RepID=UPI002E8E2441|nr:hypothetical protein [Cellulosilyticum ruminicola]